MATRTIVTSQPDVACHVCERRLLRGEQPEVFLVAGRPRTVCELCAPRAAHQGWLRETGERTPGPAPLRPGRGRNLFERLRSVKRPPAAAAGERTARAAWREQEPEAYDFLDSAPQATAATLDSAADGHGHAHSADGLEPEPAPAPDGPLQSAVAIFNAGEYPRRIASLARSLGAPEVTVRAGEAVASSVVIVIAWELCWYTYEVDLHDMQGARARAIAQGTELSEVGPEDRQANALADERGALALV